MEDKRDAATSLAASLAIEGHDVAVAYDGAEGMARAKSFAPDLLLCDTGLPGMDGFTVARAFRADEALRHTRLVALSGYAMPEDLQRSAEAGFGAHMANRPPSRSCARCSPASARLRARGASSAGCSAAG